MAGQGCPLSFPLRMAVAWVTSQRRLRVWADFVGASILLVVACCMACLPARAEDLAEPTRLTFEVRAVWGGGPVRTFAGKIAITGGTLSVVRNLSVQDDAGGTLQKRGQAELEIRPHSPSSFGGLDLLVSGAPDSELEFQWQDASGGNPPEPVRVRLSQLLHERVMQPIDQRGSRLAIERQSHDRLRASVNQGEVIFAPGERCTLTVEGYCNKLSAGEHRLNVRLFDLAGDRVVENFQRDVQVNDQGSFSPQTISDIELPTQPGVYSFEIGIQRRRLINSFISAIGVADRKLEIVVVGNQMPPQMATEWRELAQIYPAGASWWDSLGRFRIPHVKTLTPLVSHVARPINSTEHGRRIVRGDECMVLTKGAWQAFPLDVERMGVPHRVRIEVPCDQPQKLAFSIQESSSVGDTTGLRLDSGLIIQPATAGDGEHVAHELVFWPRTTHPYLLVLNADLRKDAAIAEVALEVAEAGLSGPHDSAEIDKAPSDPSAQTRLAAIYFDKPLLAENFGAPRRLDVKGHRELDSWQTCYEASTRLADYTAWSGYNSAILTIATQGGAIYPSKVLDPSPKFDSGMFLSDGSSLAIKDMTELVCREFDRRGLKLILAIELEGALPELAKIENADAIHGSLYQVNRAGVVSAPGDHPEASPITRYNPLDARVQTVLSRAVKEILDRYAGHPCFAGIQLNLSERSHFNFAGDRWGYDAASLQHLEREMGAPLPADPVDRDRMLSGALRPTFLADRAKRLSQFYVRLADEVARSRSGARLLLNPAKLLGASPSAENFADVESKVFTPSEVLLGCGIDPSELIGKDSILLLRPECDSPLRVPVARAWAFQVAGDTQLDAALTGKDSGAIVQQIPTGFRLPDFDKASPFGNENSRTWLFPHVSSGGNAARRALVSRVFHADTQVLANGGWLALMGQENAVRPMLSVLEQLPPITLANLQSDKASATLRGRRGQYDGRTYLQFVNNASWQETVTVQVQAGEDTTIRELGLGDLPERPLKAGQPFTYEMKLPPYSLSALRIDSDKVKTVSVASAPDTKVTQTLERRLNELQSYIDRAGELNEQQTLGLRGGDFETWNSDGQPLGWTISSQPSTSIVEERELPRSGLSCVRIENKGNGAASAWIQSDRIAIPSTGRLALEVWVRSAPGLEQPTVRLSLIGRYRDGKRFQRWHEFAPSARAGGQIPIDWGRRPLVLLVPDVPSDDLNELQVAIDLVGPGRLWIDDVRVFGMYLHPDEKVHLLGQMFLAKEQMSKGDFALADYLLESFWACFLSTYLAPPAAPSAEASDSPSKESGKITTRPPRAAPKWRSSGQPRINQWQENMRQRWQR